VDTVRYFRHVYHGDRLFFMIGADAFLDIPMWKEYETLLTLCEFPLSPIAPGIPHGSAAPGDAAGLDGARRCKKKKTPLAVVAQLQPKPASICSKTSSSEVFRYRCAAPASSVASPSTACFRRGPRNTILKQGLYK